jgi:transcriptional regulator with XRE-family HTH domain
MTDETTQFVKALDDLELALGDSIEMTERMRARIQFLRRQLAAGLTLPEIVPAEESPLLVQLLTESANLLHTYGTRVRRTEARALHSAGMTMDEIARLFGVSRQRVSALLRSEPGTAEDSAPEPPLGSE